MQFRRQFQNDDDYFLSSFCGSLVKVMWLSSAPEFMKKLETAFFFLDELFKEQVFLDILHLLQKCKVSIKVALASCYVTTAPSWQLIKMTSNFLKYCDLMHVTVMFCDLFGSLLKVMSTFINWTVLAHHRPVSQRHVTHVSIGHDVCMRKEEELIVVL